MSRPDLHGLLAEFHAPAEIVRAAHAVHAAGFRKVDAYTPYPMEEVLEALHLHHSHVPKLVLGGGLVGLAAGWGLQYWASVIEYPMNIGGRPFNAWPAFVVPSFETTVLFAALAAVFGMLALNGFPQPYHPVFNVPGFSAASRDRFFLCIEADDPQFDRKATLDFLKGLGAADVQEVMP
jgi:Alternative complex III, ActD subunit